MKRFFTPVQKSTKNPPRNPLSSSKNWESNIRSVIVEPCDHGEDTIGYKAIFYLTFEAAKESGKQSFEVGASFLAQRMHNLKKAGYSAPMTDKAISAIEDKLGETLPMFLGLPATVRNGEYA